MPSCLTSTFGLFKHLGDVVKFMWFLYHTVDDYNGIIQISAADEVVFVKHFQFMEKAKRSARSDFFFELPDVGDGRMLTSQNRRVVIDHYRYAIVVKGKGCDFNVASSFAVEYTVPGLQRNREGHFVLPFLLLSGYLTNWMELPSMIGLRVRRVG